MNFMLTISDLVVPIVFFAIILYGYGTKIDVYESFIKGAREGMEIVARILPTILGLMVAVGILRASGIFELVSAAIAPITGLIRFPAEVVPLIFMRFISSSAATGLVLDLFKNFGPDSFTGRFVSVMMSCTETIFYTMSVYFMSVGVKKSRYTLFVAIASNIAGIIASFYITIKVFGF